MHIYIYIYTFIYIERKRDRDRYSVDETRLVPVTWILSLDLRLAFLGLYRPAADVGLRRALSSPRVGARFRYLLHALKLL